MIYNKKGQTAIWVIAAVAFVAVMFFLFIFNRAPTTTTTQLGNILAVSIDECVRQLGIQAINIMLPQGGFISPIDYKEYTTINVSYLCKSSSNYIPCVNQHPLLLNEESKQIENYTQQPIETCFSNAQKELEDQGYNVSMGKMQLNVSFSSNEAHFVINRNINISKGKEAQIFNEFEITLNTPLYDLSNVAMEIANEQVKTCSFGYVQYMALHPRFDIQVFTFSDSTRIYTITDKQTSKVMNIAIKGCVIPPGGL